MPPRATAFAAAPPLPRARAPRARACAPRPPRWVAVASGEAAASNAAPADPIDLPRAPPLPPPPLDDPSVIASLDDVEELIELVDEFGLYDFRVEDNGVAVEISRSGGRGFEDGKLVRAPPPPAEVVEYQTVAEEAVEEEEEEEDDEALDVQAKEAPKPPADPMSDPDTVYDSDFVVKSNRVGFFYSGAKNKPPLVNVGDHVDFNQPVCIIEQLGQQYVYLSEASGTVTKVFVEDGDSVEYDQQIMVIRPD